MTFEGTIDDVRIYSEALDPDEVAAQFSACIAVDRGVCDWFDVPGLGRVHITSYDGNVYIDGQKLEPVEPVIPEDTSWHRLEAFFSGEDFVAVVDGKVVAGDPRLLPEED